MAIILGLVSVSLVIMGFAFMSAADMHKCPYCNRRFDTNKGKLIHIARKHDN